MVLEQLQFCTVIGFMLFMRAKLPDKDKKSSLGNVASLMIHKITCQDVCLYNSLTLSQLLKCNYTTIVCTMSTPICNTNARGTDTHLVTNCIAAQGAYNPNVVGAHFP